MQSAKVDAIAWTGSGDGIVSGGTEVMLWKRNSKSWEIAWKFRMKVPQTLISTTWSLEGPTAAGAYPILKNQGLFPLMQMILLVYSCTMNNMDMLLLN